MKNRKIVTLVIGMILYIFMGRGADAFLIYLTIPNESGMPVMTYAKVDGSVIGDGTDFRFEVNLAPNLESALNGGSNFGLDKFFFNTDLTLTSNMFTNFDPSVWSINSETNADGFGKFTIELSDPGNRSDHLYFDIDYASAVSEANFKILSDDPAGNGHGNFAAHIAGFGYNGIGSTFVRDNVSVPELQSIYLLSITLVGVVFSRKILKDKNI